MKSPDIRQRQVVRVLCVIISASMAVAATRQRPRKLLVAHGVASHTLPEHTLAAYRLAIEQEADFVEQDLQTSTMVCSSVFMI